MISLLIFVVQLYVFIFGALYLHRQSPRIGLAPLLFMVAGIIGLMNVIELNSLVIGLSDTTLRPGAHVFVPVSLTIILVLYVTQGTRPTQVAVAGIVGVQFLVFMTLIFMSAYTMFYSEGTTVSGLFADDNRFDLLFMRGMLASLIAFTADMLILIIMYQGIHNHMKWIPAVLASGIALVVALWTDAAVFTIGAFAGTESFTLTVPGDILMKTIAGLLVAPVIGIYLTRFAPDIQDFVGVDKRHTLSILFRSAYRDTRVETLESELRVSRSIYNQLTQHIEEIFWLIDIEEKRFIYVSPAYERITEYSVEPLYQDINNLMEIIHEDDRINVENGILDFLVHEQDTEFRIVCPNKIVRTLRARSFPIKEAQGNVIRYAGIAEDITERKQLTEQEFELALTRERMQILHNFVRDASHDLKTPISSMVLKIGLLDRVDDEERRREIREELRGRALHLSNLITDLFTLSRIEGHDDIEMITIGLNDVVAGVVQDTHMLADEKGLSITVTLSENDSSLTGNYEQINRVVSNLVSNAIRYTQEGSVTIRTWLEDEFVCLSVTDTGIGIPADSIHMVFERFFRTGQAKDTQEGTGLGLAISKAIAERHHGSIQVESADGQGSMFLLKLPKTQPEKVIHTDKSRTEQEIRVLPSDA